MYLEELKENLFHGKNYLPPNKSQIKANGASFFKSVTMQIMAQGTIKHIMTTLSGGLTPSSIEPSPVAISFRFLAIIIITTQQDP